MSKKIQNALFANKELNSQHGKIKFDEKGQAEVEDNVAEYFLSVPGYTVVGEEKTDAGTPTTIVPAGEESDKKETMLEGEIKELLSKISHDDQIKVLSEAASAATKAFNDAEAAGTMTEEAAHSIGDTTYIETIKKLVGELLAPPIDFDADIPTSDLPSDHQEEEGQTEDTEKSKDATAKGTGDGL